MAPLIPYVSAGECRVSPDSPFDSYGNICFEDEKARLDNFAIALQQNPEWIGYIVVYAGNESCAGEAQYRATELSNELSEEALRRSEAW